MIAVYSETVPTLKSQQSVQLQNRRPKRRSLLPLDVFQEFGL